ncbi:MAG: alpha-ketoglutarate-dependent dioxygenase AlkB family protein [Gammaproteobacteria bacterium]
MVCSSLQLIEGFYDSEESSRILRYFLTQHDWPDNHYYHAGRRFLLPRLQTWHADAGVRYSYSNNLLSTRPWTNELSELRAKITSRLDRTFNSVLVNYYRHGGDYVGWHADDEAELSESPCIASLSFGADRVFSFRHKRTLETGSLILPAGGLLIMYPEFQRDWLHSVPIDHKVSRPRINLTFRTVVEPNFATDNGRA